MEDKKFTGKQIADNVMIDKQMTSIDNELAVAMYLIVQSGTRQTTGKDLYEALGEARLNLANKSYARKGTQLGHEFGGYDNGYVNALNQVLDRLEDDPETSIHDIKRYIEENIKEVKEDGI